MLIIMLVAMAGAAFSVSPGDITNHPDVDEALRLIEAGFARALTDAEADAWHAEKAKAAEVNEQAKAKSDAARAQLEADASVTDEDKAAAEAEADAKAAADAEAAAKAEADAKAAADAKAKK